MCHRRRIAGQAGRENPVQEARGAEPGFIETNYVVDFTDGQTYFNSINTLRGSLSDPIGQTSMFRARNTGDQIAVSMCKDGAIKAQIIMEPQNFYVVGYLNPEDKTQIMSAIDENKKMLTRFICEDKSITSSHREVTYLEGHHDRLFCLKYFENKNIEEIDFLDFATLVSEAIRFRAVQIFFSKALRINSVSLKSIIDVICFDEKINQNANIAENPIPLNLTETTGWEERIKDVLIGMVNDWTNVTSTYDKPYFHDLQILRRDHDEKPIPFTDEERLNHCYIRLHKRYFVRFSDAHLVIGAFSKQDLTKGLTLK